MLCDCKQNSPFKDRKNYRSVSVLRGACESFETREKAILMACNMRKISTVAATRLKATVTDISDEDKD
ncbi:MAG: hypothetical protein ACJARN_000060 [Arenicella sp.]